MKLATVKKLLKEEPSNLSADQVGRICLYNYFSEETDKGSIFDLDQLSELIMSQDMTKTQQVYMYIKMIASLRHMRLIAERCEEQVYKVLTENAHAISIIGFVIYKLTKVQKVKGLSDAGLIKAVSDTYPIMLKTLKEGQEEIEDALMTVLAYNKILDIIKEHYKEDLAEDLKIDTTEIGNQMRVIWEQARDLRLPPYFREYLFIHKLEDTYLNEDYIKLAKKFVVNVENYNTFLPTGNMLRVLTEGYDNFIK